ncbi:MAG: DPP IV N-terminal domain-containing protein, partial [Planctomycetes bacterium]|nr:DPP IV N-terminal domain-containing protein [Planctomycetota bacterium]
MNLVRKPSLLICLALLLISVPTVAQEAVKANYDQAKKFSTSFLRQFTYGSAVSPQWIGKTDLFWYSFKTSDGTHYWLVDPNRKSKVELFDRESLAAQLTEACRKARDAGDLKIASLKLDDTGEKMTFTADEFEFEYERSTGKLTKKDKKKKAAAAPSRSRRSRSSDDEKKETEEDLTKRRDKVFDDNLKKYYKKKKNGGKEEEEVVQTRSGRGRSRGSSSSPFSPDMKLYTYAKGHNIYVIERSGDLPPEPKDEEEKPETAKGRGESVEKVKDKENGKENGAEKDEKKGDKPKKKRAPFPFPTKKGQQLSKNGEKDYSFGGGGEEDALSEAKSVNWAPDGSAFHVTRSDSRGVAELWLVDSLGKPRPKLKKYKYPMPGEEKIRRSELFVYHHGKKTFIHIKPKWKDEWYSDVKWLKNGELRMIRRDRLRRNLEYGVLNPETGDFKVLISEGFENANQTTQSVKYLEDRKELVWWSERTGWGHYYLYGMDGKLKNVITKGRFRASSIIDVDEEKGLLWFRANGRESGENIYYEHLYRVRLDGGGLKLLDPGNGTHRSSMSKSRRFVVDTWSRVDQANQSVLRDSEGRRVMPLDNADVSRIEELGWKPPTPFKVKAADGITDLYGNMWKPFDFDPNKKYPLIVHVYPGPQMENVTHTFSATGSRQELAQIGFIVIQVGHRGGTPKRSKAYGAYGYFNLRDYGLVDKKAAIEQLAARHSFINIDRIGIYGHSGGGFMTAAALLQKPYNDFFTVGVSTAGNHDNNVYNNSWSERYHGLKEVEVKEDKKKDGDKKDGDKKVDGKKVDGKKVDGKKVDGKKDGDKKVDGKKVDGKKDGDKKDD